MKKNKIFLFLIFTVVACGSHPKAKQSKESEKIEDTLEGGFPRDTTSFKNYPLFAWPTKYPYILAYFGWRKKKMHEGLDLKAPTGTRVYAAAKGEIIEAGTRIRGYGKTVVLDHGDGWSTIYAHLSKIKVKRGQLVKRGHLIALSGRTGRASGPHLHFEIRKGSDPLDPLMFLPPVEGDHVDSESID